MRFGDSARRNSTTTSQPSSRNSEPVDDASLPSSASATHSRAAATPASPGIEVASSLCTLRAHLLLMLQVCIRLGGGLPAATGIARPAPGVPVVAIDRAVLAGINIVLAGRHAGVRVGVVCKTGPPCRALAGVDVAGVSSAAARDDAGVWVIGRAAAI